MLLQIQRSLLAFVFVMLFPPYATMSLDQNTTSTVPPVIDVHVHAMDESFPGGPMCPNESKFLASDPSTKEAPSGWSPEECTPKLYPAAKGEYIKDVVAEMERMNVTAVVFGDPKSVQFAIHLFRCDNRSHTFAEAGYDAIGAFLPRIGDRSFPNGT
jgi:hypothetical protein